MFDVYLVTDRRKTAERPLAAVVKEALAGGVKALQLREKDLLPRDLFTVATELRHLTHKAGAKLLINGRMDICLAVGADGVHLPSDHLPTSLVRKVVGKERIIGISVHTLKEAVTAEKEGADYVVMGPIYWTLSKASYGSPLGIEALREATQGLSIPVFAIGGITIEKVKEVLEAGASGVAVVSSILSAAHVREASTRLIEEVRRHRCEPSENRLTTCR